MKLKRQLLPALALIVGSIPFRLAFGQTPEQALVEIALASKSETVEKHLPESFLQEFRHLTPADRNTARSKIMGSVSLFTGGGDVIIPEDGHALLTIQPKNSEDKLEVRVQRQISNGLDALLELTFSRSDNYGEKVLVWMRFEEEEWRVVRLEAEDAGRGLDLDEPDFVKRFRTSNRRSSDDEIAGVMSQLLSGLSRYESADPEAGFPADLSLLASPQGDTGQDGTDFRPGNFVDPELASNEFTRFGYTFRYELTRGGREGDFAIVARPAEMAVGARSYFVDASGRVRFTDEDRDPTAEDPPVQ